MNIGGAITARIETESPGENPSLILAAGLGITQVRAKQLLRANNVNDGNKAKIAAILGCQDWELLKESHNYPTIYEA